MAEAHVEVERAYGEKVYFTGSKYSVVSVVIVRTRSSVPTARRHAHLLPPSPLTNPLPPLHTHTSVCLTHLAHTSPRHAPSHRSGGTGMRKPRASSSCSSTSCTVSGMPHTNGSNPRRQPQAERLQLQAERLKPRTDGLHPRTSRARTTLLLTPSGLACPGQHRLAPRQRIGFAGSAWQRARLRRQ